MAKRKRREYGEAKDLFINLGLPEVDGIINRLQFNQLDSPSLKFIEDQSSKKDFIRFRLERHRENLSSPTTPLEKDVISRLPDEILQFIISSLSTREGAATCVLSRRWRSLWTSSVSRLNFDIPTMRGHDYPVYMFRDSMERSQRCQYLLAKKRYEFTQWVDRVLHLRSASRLDWLRVCFVLDKGSASRIDRWIKSAFAQGVSEVELDFSNDRFSWFPCNDTGDFYEFSARENAPSLKYLRLKQCSFHMPRDFTGFASLKSVSLNFICTTQHAMDNLLSNCPLLECLSLVNSTISNTTNLTISGPLPSLKHLHIKNSYKVESIEVHDVNLLSLELIRPLSFPKVSLKNAPCLARLVLFADMQIETLSNVPHLENLFLSQSPELSHGLHNLQTCVFSNLKRLVFLNGESGMSFLGVVRLLETCHSLQELELNMYCAPVWRDELTETMAKLTTVPRVHHNNLKEVAMYGFVAHPERIAFAKYLLSYANALEKMEIYTTEKLYCGNGNWTFCELSSKKVQEKSLAKAREQLQKVARSSTKLELATSPNL